MTDTEIPLDHDLIAARMNTEEYKRLAEDRAKTKYWRRWGPYVSDRQWGTVREDYSAGGNAWEYFSHDHARSRAYRWGEDGIAGISDNHQRLCFAIALWNGADPILKERLFGLTNSEGNHGEDVKEYYFYLDNTPTHAYMHCLYKYPHNAFPYSQLVEENRRRKATNSAALEFELLDSGVFNANRYFDVFVEYAKYAPEDMLIQLTVVNRGPEQKTLQLLPTLWFRNTWSWGITLFSLDAQFQTALDNRQISADLQQAFAAKGYTLPPDFSVTIETPGSAWQIADADQHPIYAVTKDGTQLTVAQARPLLKATGTGAEVRVVEAFSAGRGYGTELLGTRWLYCERPDELLFTQNDTNRERFGWGPNPAPYVKDGINNYIVHGQQAAVNPNQEGTKVSAVYRLDLAPGETRVVRLRLSDQGDLAAPFGSEFDTVLQQRQQEADDFYQAINPFPLSDDMRRIQRQAFAGMLWTKQFYYYVVQDWLDGDPVGPPPPPQRKNPGGRNVQWTQLFNRDILSMPDKWEYPWFAAWDLAFHMIPFALIDPDFAKRQLYLFTREWYMHPNGQLPAYEWAFGDVNPPVHAWAVWRVYQIEQKMYGCADKAFLEQVFQKLALYFTWWVNRKDEEGNNIFSGGFLGLDNIGVFDRSNLRIPGASIEQSDGTSWMAMYCLNLLKMATELAKDDPTSTYEDMASKFFQHFLLIADGLNKLGGADVNIWDTTDNFYYDVLRIPRDALPEGNDPFTMSMKVRSMVGLIPLFAVEAIDQATLDRFLSSDFKPRFDWFLRNRPELTQHGNISLRPMQSNLMEGGITFAVVNPERLRLILQRMLDEAEFLSPYGIRALSKIHAPDQQPYQLPFRIKTLDGIVQPRVEYEPAESRFGLFGGNSNWRGPVWFPVNYLLIETLQKFHCYLGDDFKVEYPAGSGTLLNLWEVARDISRRLIDIFAQDVSGRRPVYGSVEPFQTDPHWRDYILFFEYFHGDIGAGIGAAHQTGWTGVVAKLIQQWAEYSVREP